MTFPAQPPDLRRLSLGRESFAALCPLALLGNASSSGSSSSARRFASRFFQRSPHGRRLAVRLGRYDQLPGGLAPPSHPPCWAHTTKAARPGTGRLGESPVLPDLSERTPPSAARDAEREPARIGEQLAVHWHTEANPRPGHPAGQ